MQHTAPTPAAHIAADSPAENPAATVNPAETTIISVICNANIRLRISPPVSENRNDGSVPDRNVASVSMESPFPPYGPQSKTNALDARFVTHAAHRHKDRRSGWIIFDLLAQTANIYVESVVADEFAGIVPDDIA